MPIDFFSWGNPVELERRRRIRLSAWAYAYEMDNAPLVDDHAFDREALLSDKSIVTGHLDDYWQSMFDPSTGLWIHSHPELGKVRDLVWRLRHQSSFPQTVATAFQARIICAPSALPSTAMRGG